MLLENEIKELNNKNDETEYELEKTRDKAFRLDRQLADTMIKVQKAASMNHSSNHGSSSANNSSSGGNNSHADQNGHNCNSSSSSNQRNANDNKVANLTDKQVSDHTHALA